MAAAVSDVRDELERAATLLRCKPLEVAAAARKLVERHAALGAEVERLTAAVLPSPPASGPNPTLPEHPLRKNARPDAEPTPPFTCSECGGTYPNHRSGCSQNNVRTAPASIEPVPFPRLRAEADLLLALYLLEHPKARPSQLSAVELIAWAASKG